jgi:general secretion pathway protein K
MSPHMTSNRKAERGAALISAMLVVTLVATLASVAMWQQWRHVEVESAERHRVQSSWLLNGALDWSRLILREDALAGVGGSTGSNADHLAEPWALPLKEAKLSTFLAQDQQVREGDPEVFLSGQITDAQSRINLTNWFEASDGKVSAKMNEPMQLALVRLFNVLDLPRAELERLAAAWRVSSPIGPLVKPFNGSALTGHGQRRFPAATANHTIAMARTERRHRTTLITLCHHLA